MKTKKSPHLKTTTRVLSVFAGLLLFSTIFMPIWKIELTAPQYPEGLEMYIHANKLSGEVEIINGLNHYIGMKELHVEDFIEFTILPYFIAVLALAAILIGLVNKKWFFYCWIVAFVLFGVGAGVDFYFWLYDYGHNLDPTAPIQVPGMSYQPPMIGFKQLLNFGAYSIPAVGGWVLFFAAFLMGIGVFNELKTSKK